MSFFLLRLYLILQQPPIGICQRREAGITMGLLRTSVDLESIEDVIAEFDKALNNI